MSDWEDYLMLLGAAVSGISASGIQLPAGTPWYVPVVLTLFVKAVKDISDARKAKKTGT